tara:strand:+ start:103 stop:225 length:123 start_codon:yes stop_codon:yes gene_type:complete
MFIAGKVLPFLAATLSDLTVEESSVISYVDIWIAASELEI